MRDQENNIGSLVWSCDANGRDPRNKKHIRYASNGNKTQGQRTSKDNVGIVKKTLTLLWKKPET